MDKFSLGFKYGVVRVSLNEDIHAHDIKGGTEMSENGLSVSVPAIYKGETKMSEKEISENVPTCEHEEWTMNDAIKYIWGHYLPTYVPGMTEYFGEKARIGTMRSIEGYARKALGPDHKMDWFGLAHNEKILDRLSKYGAGKATSCPLGKQHASGHDRNDMAKDYVEMVGGDKTLVPDKSERGIQNRARVEEAERVQRENAILESRKARVSEIMGAAMASENFKAAVQGTTKRVVTIMNGYNAEEHDRFVSAMGTMKENFAVYAEYIDLMVGLIPSKPEHEYTEAELTAMFPTYMPALKAHDQQYTDAFVSTEEENAE